MTGYALGVFVGAPMLSRESALAVARVFLVPEDMGTTARALIGKKTGDTIEVNTPGGGKSYEIIDVLYR